MLGYIHHMYQKARKGKINDMDAIRQVHRAQIKHADKYIDNLRKDLEAKEDRIRILEQQRDLATIKAEENEELAVKLSSELVVLEQCMREAAKRLERCPFCHAGWHVDEDCHDECMLARSVGRPRSK